MTVDRHVAQGSLTIPDRKTTASFSKDDKWTTGLSVSSREKLINSYEEYLEILGNGGYNRIMPAIEIVLSTEDLSHENNPGYEHGNP